MASEGVIEVSGDVRERVNSAMDVLHQAERCWSRLDTFREERARAMRYTYGDQWSDYVRDERGMWQKEESMIRSQGGIALQNNMIRKLVNTVKGLYINQNTEPICVARDRSEQSMTDCLTELLKYVGDINSSKSLNADAIEEFVISGFCGYRKSYGLMQGRMDCWTTAVDPEKFFVDSTMRDQRGWDCNIVGEIHDMAWGDLLNCFARNVGDVQRLRDMYGCASDARTIRDSLEDFGVRHHLASSFLMGEDTGMCRVIEVWTKERKARYHCHDYATGELYKIETADKWELVDKENARRLRECMSRGLSREEASGVMITAQWYVDTYWYYRFMSPRGEVITEGETPYAHGSHPFVFRYYPFIDGRIHSYVSDLIDIQRYVNRLINLNDYLLRSGAKGLLAVPDTALEGTGLTIEELADVWAKPGGVYVYHAKAGVSVPQQITTQTTNIGVSELLQIEKQFFDDITGVNGALQGKYAGNISGSYYALQTQNSAISLQGVLLSFSEFLRQGAIKDCSMIQQYYDGAKIEQVAGVQETALSFDASKVKDIECDVNISESTTTPAFRQTANEFLMQIWQSGQISLRSMLETGAFPWGDKLLAAVKREEDERAAAQQAMQEQAMQEQASAQQGAQALPSDAEQLNG